MNADSPSSTVTELKILTRKTDVQEMMERIKDKGYDPSRLAVFFLDGKEMLIGEVDREVRQGAYEDLLSETIWVRNPKRYMRIQQVTQAGVAITTFIGDLDAVDSGTIQVRAVAAYWLKDIGEESQRNTLKILLQYFEQKAQSRAAEAGLVFPQRQLPRH